MEKDNVHWNTFYSLIELIYQVPYRGYNMQIQNQLKFIIRFK